MDRRSCGCNVCVVVLLVIALLAIWGVRTVAAVLSKYTCASFADPQQIGKLKTRELKQQWMVNDSFELRRCRLMSIARL